MAKPRTTKRSGRVLHPGDVVSTSSGPVRVTKRMAVTSSGRVLVTVPPKPMASLIAESDADTVALAELIVHRTRRVPTGVHLGMVIAAWARAEHCDVSIVEGGRLELRCRFAPSAGLEGSFARHLPAVVGVLGWAVPTLFGQGRLRAFAASWPYVAWGGD